MVQDCFWDADGIKVAIHKNGSALEAPKQRRAHESARPSPRSDSAEAIDSIAPDRGAAVATATASLAALTGGYNPAPGSAVQWLMGIAKHKFVGAWGDPRKTSEGSAEPWAADRECDPFVNVRNMPATARGWGVPRLTRRMVLPFAWSRPLNREIAALRYARRGQIERDSLIR